MAELFSLMLESTSCKSDPVEATRTPSRTILPDLFQLDALATRRSHQSNHQDTKAQRNNSFPLAACGHEYSSCLGVCVFLGAFVFSFLLRKSMTEKAAESNPLARNRQHFQGVYFLSH
ncbi:MAG: hypothetical protein WAU33_01010 [Candidatus Binataceae bacterium]